MNDNNEFLKQMENLQVPDVNPSHQNTVKMALMNADRSVKLGVWMIIMPAFFFACVGVYYYSHGGNNWFAAMFYTLINMDNIPYADFVLTVLMFVLPLACLIINVLGILHVQVQKIDEHRKKLNELSITIKIKPLNLILIAISILILCGVMGFAMTENISITK
jgi:hypothetical protein